MLLYIILTKNIKIEIRTDYFFKPQLKTFKNFLIKFILTHHPYNQGFGSVKLRKCFFVLLLNFYVFPERNVVEKFSALVSCPVR